MHKTRITEKKLQIKTLSELVLLCDILQELPDLNWDLQEGDIDLKRGNKK
jgi:hypothetical protein